MVGSSKFGIWIPVAGPNGRPCSSISRAKDKKGRKVRALKLS